MPNHLQDPLLTYSKPVLTKEEQEDDKMVSLQAESIVNIVAFPMVLKAALELGVIDTIAAAGNDVWLSPYEIARSLPTKPTNPEAPVLLDRMLRLLVSHSVLKCRMVEGTENGRAGKMEMIYATEPVCKYFLKFSDGSGSLVPMFMLLHTEVFFKTWTNLKDVILEGRDAFSSAHGMRLFEYINSDGKFAKVFDRAMSEPSTMILKKLLEAYKGFEDVNTLVDVGGGSGTTLGLVTSKYPHIKGVNFDLPQVLANAPLYPGVEHVSGDMFIEVPKGDAVFMKWILHDWTDELCIKLLKNCWKSLPENGKVIIVDLITPSEPKSGDFSSNFIFGMDMLMLTQCSGGKERSFSQLENLAFGSGFLRCEVVCYVHSYSVIEFQK
ncbi:O-methyltransferase family protein [Raphanus sativus]|uniref:Indole glucosinolate O-methyltransferase 1 n=1 Tax=Raphanus sativus TaxID=3726 RepID=A0A6J0MQ33_RAPSA|nr:indole glucosinolate O-methyltransferase 1 [Raphanus sativus]KAJ4906276.1 O-methyltransferase family protein [Raphanus sativus]